MCMVYRQIACPEAPTTSPVCLWVCPEQQQLHVKNVFCVFSRSFARNPCSHRRAYSDYRCAASGGNRPLWRDRCLARYSFPPSLSAAFLSLWHETIDDLECTWYVLTLCGEPTPLHDRCNERQLAHHQRCNFSFKYSRVYENLFIHSHNHHRVRNNLS